MTREEAIRILDPETTAETLAEIAYNAGSWNDPSVTKAVNDACILAVAALRAQEERKWIPVTEQLPDLIPCLAGTAYSEAVLILTSYKKVMVSVWDGVDWIAAFDFWEAWDEEVTHWIPLPELPKEGK